MRKQPHNPRLSRQGFVPAGNGKPPTRRHMAIPKGQWTGGPEAWNLYHAVNPLHEQIAGKLDGPERQALRDICELGSIEQVNGVTYIVAPIPSRTADVLATFEANREDIEDDNVDREDDASGADEDLEPTHDLEAAHR